MSEKQIELICKKNDSLELTDEAFNFLLSLKSQNLYITSVNGPSNNILSNKLISKENDGFSPNEENIYIWSKVIDINETNKILIIDYKGTKNNNIFLINLLISSYYIYNTSDDLEENSISNFLNDINIKDLIDFKHKDYIPNIICNNEKLSGGEIKNKIENNHEFMLRW